MSTSASPDPDRLTGDRQGVDDIDTHAAQGGPTSPGPDSTAAAAATAGSGTGDVNEPDTGPGPAAADVDANPRGTD